MNNEIKISKHNFIVREPDCYDCEKCSKEQNEKCDKEIQDWLENKD